MAQPLSAEQVDSYHRDGFLYPLPALSEAEVLNYRRRLEAFEASQGAPLGELPGQLRAKSHLLFSWADELVRHPAILDAVESLIGPDILVYHLTCWIKNAFDGRFVSWHQDGTYFYLEPYEHITAWVALTDATPENGCMEAIPGSHQHGQQPHVTAASRQNLLSNGQTIDAAIDDKNAVTLEVPAGSFSLHHTHTIHRSRPNQSNDRRIGIGISYIPTRVRGTDGRRLSAALVRGRDSFGHFDAEPRPVADFDAAARAAHGRACQRFFSSHGARREQARA